MKSVAGLLVCHKIFPSENVYYSSDSVFVIFFCYSISSWFFSTCIPTLCTLCAKFTTRIYLKFPMNLSFLAILYIRIRQNFSTGRTTHYFYCSWNPILKYKYYSFIWNAQIKVVPGNINKKVKANIILG